MMDPMSQHSEDASGFSAPGDDPTKKQIIKKRTKTGCYTCRRRRIKCDEAKPRCNNCIKSKRQCEGYTQRVIFKDPIGTFHHMGPMAFHPSGSQHILLTPQSIAAQNARAMSNGSLPVIAPRPPPPMGTSHAVFGHPNVLHMQAIPNHHSQLLPQPHMSHIPHMPHLPNMPNMNLAPMATAPGPYAVPAQPPLRGPGQFVPGWEVQQPPFSGHGATFAEPTFPQQGSAPDEWKLEESYGHLPPTPTPAPGPVPDLVPIATSGPDPVPVTVPAPLPTHSPVPTPPLPPQPQMHAEPLVVPSRTAVFDEEDVYWYSDDDASMAESEDEDMHDGMEHLKSNELGAIVARRLPNRVTDEFGTQLRTFSSFADANVLANYVPSSLNSPLTDAQTASVFWYFVNVTSPSMSLFERHPVDPGPLFEGRPVPRSRQHIWTYTFPTIALNHPALLQAMLALGSLHMAKLQGIPATASMKHYHLSLRRLSRNYQSASRRVQPATLATAMLLSFYEVWNSDHDKWCKHLWGARAILREIPLRQMTKKMIVLKKQRRQVLEGAGLGQYGAMFEDAIVSVRDIDQVDSQFVARLSGQPVRYDEDDEDDMSAAWTTPDQYTEKDIKTYHIFCDLFWWFLKMDVYQSILGGTRLLMDYRSWTQCAPRAPIGKIDVLYGTYDHLILLLGRLCDFSSHDQARKRRAKRSDGPPGAPGQGMSPPPFVGMMPTTGNITIPKGLTPPREPSPESDSQEEMDFEASTAVALREWTAIRQTFDAFREQLGPDFDPLGPEYEPPAASPFGLVLKYRTYGIASIWLNYYMGMIALYRCHPSMPHIAMAAAAMAGRQTAPYATEIGRIIAGLTAEDLSTMVHVSTLLGAVSIECSFPLFVAAVQFQDTAQRHWTVRRMHNVARLTGWQSARHIAIGCETGWTKAASMGRGPPYESPTDVVEVPQSIWNRPKRIVDRIRELEDDDEQLVLSSAERSTYAVGILSMETDLERLELSDRT